MEELGWFRYILPALAGAIGTTAFIWLANKGRPGLQRCYTSGWLIGLFGAGVVMFGTSLFAVLLQTDRQDGLNDEVWLPYALFSAVCVFVWATVDAVFRKVDWDDRQVRFRKMFWASRTVDWKDITSVRYNSWTQYFRIGFADGSGFGLSEVMTGSRGLIAEIERRSLAR